VLLCRPDKLAEQFAMNRAATFCSFVDNIFRFYAKRAPRFRLCLPYPFLLLATSQRFATDMGAIARAIASTKSGSISRSRSGCLRLLRDDLTGDPALQIVLRTSMRQPCLDGSCDLGKGYFTLPFDPLGSTSRLMESVPSYGEEHYNVARGRPPPPFRVSSAV